MEVRSGEIWKHGDQPDGLFSQHPDKPPKGFDPEKVYPNFSKPKGPALIINNQKFDRSEDRNGSEKDAKKLQDLFSSIGYKVKTKQNLSAKKMVKALNKMCVNSKYEHCDSAIIAIMSHGGKGSMYGSDEATVPIEHLLLMMDNEHCANFRGKAKLFFFQACRGDLKDPGKVGAPILVPDMAHNFGNSAADGDIPEKVPRDADMFIAYSTTPGCVAWRNNEQGSWFINAIYDVFLQSAAHEDLLSMITEVNQRVSMKDSSSGHKQISEVWSRLTKKFFFFPKWSTLEAMHVPQLVDTEYPSLWNTTKDKLKDFYKESFSCVQIIPMDKGSNIGLDQIWINVRTSGIYGNTTDDYKSCLASAKAHGLPVVVSGEAGSGKSTLLKRICFGWTQQELQQYDLVLVARLRDISSFNSDMLDLCLQWYCEIGLLDLHEAIIVREVIETRLNPNRVLILLDGLDEKVPDCSELTQLFQLQVKTKVMKYPVVITARPYKVNEISCDHHFCKLLPFTASQQHDFITKFYEFQGANGCKEKAKGFITKLNSTSKKIQKTLSVPLNLQLCLVSGYFMEHFSQTELFTAIISTMIETFLQNHENCCLSTEDWMESPIIHRLSQLAFAMLQKGDDGVLCFPSSALRDYGVPFEVSHVGLLQEERGSGCKLQTYYSFPHKTFHEFFAALHLSRSAKELKHFMFDIAEDCMLRMRCHHVIIFLFGLLNSQGKIDAARELMQEVGMKVFPYITENVCFLFNLRHECKTDAQRATVDQYYQLSISPRKQSPMNPAVTGEHWLNMTLNELQKEFPLHLRQLREGIFEWEFYEDVLCKTMPVAIIDGFSEELMKSDSSQLQNTIAGHKIVHYCGPCSSLNQFACILSSGIEVLKIQLVSGPDVSTGTTVKWPDIPSLRDLRIDLAHLDYVPTFLLDALKDLAELLNGKPARFAALAAGHVTDFPDFILPTSVHYFKLKRFTLQSSSISQLSLQLPLCKDLEIVRIHKCHIQDSDVLNFLSCLRNCCSLRDLSFVTIKCIGKLAVLAKAAVHFIEIPKLELLTLQDCGITDECFDTLCQMIELSQLKMLFIGWNRNKATLDKLKYLKNKNDEEVQVSFDFLSWHVNYQTGPREMCPSKSHHMFL